MSTENSGGDKTSATDDEQSLEVTVIGYPNPDAFSGGQWRDFACDVLPDTDWHAESTYETSHAYLLLPPADESDEERDRIEVSDQSQAESIAARREDVRVEVETTEKSTSEHSRYDFGTDFRRALLDELPDSVGDLRVHSNGRVTLGGDDIATITTGVKRWEQRLTPRSERTDDNRFESAAEMPAMSVTVDFKNNPSEQVNAWKDTLLAEAMPVLGRWSGIETVRVAECTVVKQGDCFV